MVLLVQGMSPQYASGLETLLRCGESILMSASSSSSSQSSTDHLRRPVGYGPGPASSAAAAAAAQRARRHPPASPASTASSRAASPSPPMSHRSEHGLDDADPARPMRKQSLSFILNSASQDQQTFADALPKVGPGCHHTAADGASCSVCNAQLTSMAVMNGTAAPTKRSADQAGIYMGLTEQSRDVGNADAREGSSPVDHDSFVSDGSDKKRRRRRASVPCDQCGRVFGEAAALRKHCRVVHEKKKDFTCDDCGRAFAEKSNLKKHAQARHGAAAKPHPCPDCGKIFSFSDGLRRHINNCHLGLRPYACPIEGCGHAFKQRTHLQKHQQSVHGVMPIEN